MPTGPAPTLGRDLVKLSASFPYARSLQQDPLRFVRPFAHDRWSAEVAAVLASTVAVGNVTQIGRSLDALWTRLGHDPAGFLERFPSRSWRNALLPWKHRWIRADHVGFMLVRLQEIHRRYPGGLEEVFRRGLASPAGLDPADRFAGGLHALSQALRWGSHDAQAPTFFEPPPGYARLFPTPFAPGRPACKRETLMVRWMVRREEPDLGLWTRVDPSDLQVPLDTHVYWIARHLGLTRRKSRDYRTVAEITSHLRRFDPADPVRFDFALAHTGISGDCPKRRDVRTCAPCTVRPDCDLWRGRPWPGAATHARAP